MKRALSFLSVFFLLLPFVNCFADTIEDFETGNPSEFAWTTMGDGDWYISRKHPYSGTYSATAPPLTDNQQAGFETMVYCDQGAIDFWASIAGIRDTSSLSFYIDDIFQVKLMPQDYLPTDAASGSDAYSPYVQSKFNVSPGMHVFSWIYDTYSGVSSLENAWIDAVSFPASDLPYLFDGFKSADLSRLPWQTEGDGAWSVGDINPRSGYYAVTAPALADNQSAVLKLDKHCNDGNLSFWLTVNTEQDSDYLQFYIDTELIEQWSGSIEYTRAAYPISSGNHSFKWIYSKDASGSVDSESIWLDSITFPGTSNHPPETPTAVSPLNESVFDAQSVTLQASAYIDPEGDDHIRTFWLIRRADKMYKDAGYDESFTNIAQSGEELTRHTVYGLISGMRYFWKVGYTDAGSADTSWSRESSFVVGTETTGPLLNVEPGAYMKDFHTLSFFRWPQKADSASVFNQAIGGLYDTTKFRIGAYDPVTGSYIELGNNLEILSGHAYWVFARPGMNVSAIGVPVTTQIDLEVPLGYNMNSLNGWNMIATPNNADYLWQNIQVVRYDDNGQIKDGPYAVSELADENGLINLSLWRWENGRYFADTTQLIRSQGYWVRAKTNNVALIFPVEAQMDAGAGDENVASRISKGMEWLNRKLLTPRIAVADDETPPLPMGVARNENDEKGGCFISIMTP